jgi:ribonuclease HI
VKFVWVKGHANIPENEKCDQLAVEASKQAMLKIDVGYEA